MQPCGPTFSKAHAYAFISRPSYENDRAKKYAG
jgi:hypothetical protein